MKNRKFSILTILLVESLFFFGFFGFLKLMGIGNPRLFFSVAFILLASFIYFGIARYIDIMQKEEQDFRSMA